MCICTGWDRSRRPTLGVRTGRNSRPPCPGRLLLSGLASPDSGEIVGIYDAGLTSSPKAVFVAAEAAFGSAPLGIKVAGLQDDIRDVVLHGDMLYLRTARMPRTSGSFEFPRPLLISHAATVVAEGEGTIVGMVAAADALECVTTRAVSIGSSGCPGMVSRNGWRRHSKAPSRG